MKTISFIELKSFILSTLREYTIDDFYFLQHGYFDYDEKTPPKINFSEVLKKIEEKYDIRTYIIEDGLVNDFLRRRSISGYNNEREMRSEDELISLNDINKTYKTIDSLISSLNNVLINPISKLIESEIVKYLSDDYIFFENWLKINKNSLENNSNYNMVEENNSLEFITILFDNYSKFYKLKGGTTISFGVKEFNEIYPEYELIKTLEWKEPLLEALSNDIPTPYMFRGNIRIDSPRYACISIQENYDIYPIWKSLKSALYTNEIIKNTNDVFFINFNNGIYARILVRKNPTVISDLTVALFSEFFKESSNSKIESDHVSYQASIFKGYTYSGFLINYGIILNYNDWVFEIKFCADAMLLQNDMMCHLAQQSSDIKKSIDEEDD